MIDLLLGLSAGLPGSVVRTILLTVVLLFIYRFITFVLYLKKVNKVYGAVPGPSRRHWLYGNFVEFPERSHDRMLYFVKLAGQFADQGYYRLWLGPMKPMIVAMSPEAVGRVLKTTEPKSRGLAGVYRFLEPWLGDGLLVSGGQKWSRSRRLLTPAFHFDILKPYMQVYNEATEILADKMGRLSEAGERFELFQPVSLCTLEIILRCAFSYDIDPQRAGEKNPYVIAVNGLTECLDYRFRRPYLYPDVFWKLSAKGRYFYRQCDFVHDVAEDIIEKRRKTLEQYGVSSRKYLDFLDILLTARDENGEGLSQLDIRNEVDTFLFEGHDTTASAISWILYSLAEYPEHQTRVQAEIDEILEGRHSDDILWADLQQMEFLSMCIKEGMRLHSPVAMVAREFTSECDLGDRVLPKNTLAQVNIWSLHHNPKVWGEDHMEFKPERFSKDNCSKMDSYQFVPFSAGPRNCIGQNFAMNEEKVVIARLLRRFTFSLDPNHVVRKKLQAVMRAEAGIMMYATPRK